MKSFSIAIRRILGAAKAHRRIVDIATRPGRPSPRDKRKQLIRRYMELFLIMARWGELSDRYYAQGMDRHGKRLSKDFLPYPKFRALRDVRNRRRTGARGFDYVCLLQDKIVFERFFSASGLPVVPSVGILTPELRFQPTCCETAVPVTEWMHQPDELVLFCKPRLGIKGGGVFRLQIGQGALRLDGTPADPERLRSALQGEVVCQHLIAQHPEYARFHPASTNTLRIITYRVGESIRVFLAYLRMGADGNITDNDQGGRAAVRINPEDGTLEREGIYMWPNGASAVTHHPDTDVPFVGTPLRYFQEAVDIASQAHHLLPSTIESVGWDVAVREDGPVLLEGNDDWGATSAMWVMPQFTQQFYNRMCH